MKKLLIIILIFLFHISIANASVVGISPSATSGKGLNQGLVGYWTFDGKDMVNGAVKDVSGSGNTGSLVSIATSTFYQPGKIGQGFNFDGVDDCVNVGAPAVLDITGSVTVSAWIKYKASLLNNKIAGKGETGGANNAWQYQLFDSGTNGVGFRVSNSTTILGSATGSNKLPNNTWHHVVGTYDGIDTTRVYLDGVQIDTDTTASFGALNSFGSVTFGRRGAAGCNAGGTNYFKGILDDVRIYNRALSATEIREIYNMGAGTKQAVSPLATSGKGLNAGLVGYWTFDGKDMVSGVPKDRSGQGNDGTLVGIATSTFYVPGKMGQGFRFDGVNDRVSISNVSAFDFSGTNRFTISAWVYPAGSNASDMIFSRGDSFSSADSITYYFGVSNTDGTRWTSAVSDGTNQILSTSASGTLTPGQWAYMTVVWNGTSLIVYKNGTSINSGTGTFTGLWNGSSAGMRLTSIGMESKDAEGYFNGRIDDVRVYNRALSTSEISQIYNQSAGTKQAVSPIATSGKGLNAGLVGYWTFDGKDMVSGKVKDRSVQGNDGSPVSIATSTFYRPGKIGQGFNFDGVNDKITLSGYSTINPGTGNFTYSAWVKSTNTANTQYILGQRLDGNNNINFSFNTGVTLFVNVGGVTVININANANVLVPANSWYHIVAVVDRATASNCKIYINGVDKTHDAATDASSLGFAATYFVGANGFGTGSFMSGVMDDVRIYNRALTATEVKQLYNLGK